MVLYELLTGEPLKKTSARPERHSRRLHEAGAVMDRGCVPPSARRLVDTMLRFEATERPAAKDIERACKAAIRELGGAELQEWAAGAVPVAATGTPEPGDLSGRTLSEEVSGVSAGETRWERAGGTPLPRGEAKPLVSGETAAVGTVATGASGTATPRQPGPVDGALATPTARDPAAPGTTGDAAPAVAAKVSVATPKPAAATTGADPSASAAAAAEPAEPAKASPPPKASVRIAGDATLVTLVGSGTYGAGEVPPGTYTIKAIFGDAEPVGSGSVTLAAGQSVSVRCSAKFRRCASE